MKKLLKNLKVLIVVLLVILLSIIAFVGVFEKDKAIWKNQVPDYKYGMDILGARELRFAIDTSEEEKYVYVDENNNIMGEVLKDGTAVTEEDNSSEDGQATEETAENPAETTDETKENAEEKSDDEEIPYSKETKTIKANSDEQLNKENFELAKKTIQKRLEKQDVSEYNIRIDDVTGSLVIETENDEDNVSKVENLVEQVGKFEVIDYQNGLRLMDNSDIKRVSVVTSTEDSTYSTYLKIELNKEGAQKLKDMSNKYVEQKTENEESEESEDTDKQKNIKYVTVKFDDTTMMTTYFDEEMNSGVMYINVGRARDTRQEALADYESAQAIASVLNLKKLPIKYSLETDNFVKSEINVNEKNVAILAGIIVLIISLVFIAIFKKEGVIAAILGIGYISLLSIIIRYVGDVDITLNSIVALIAVIAMNYIFEWLLLSNQKQNENAAFGATMKKFWICSIPVIVSTLVFIFNTALRISSIGMVMFWGILLLAIYNLIFTRTVLRK